MKLGEPQIFDHGARLRERLVRSCQGSASAGGLRFALSAVLGEDEILLSIGFAVCG